MKKKDIQSKTLEQIIYSLPIFDDTETDKPCLENLLKELGLKDKFEEEQEDMAYRIVQLLANATKLLEKSKELLESVYYDAPKRKENNMNNLKGWVLSNNERGIL